MLLVFDHLFCWTPSVANLQHIPYVSHQQEGQGQLEQPPWTSWPGASARAVASFGKDPRQATDMRRCGGGEPMHCGEANAQRAGSVQCYRAGWQQGEVPAPTLMIGSGGFLGVQLAQLMGNPKHGKKNPKKLGYNPYTNLLWSCNQLLVQVHPKYTALYIYIYIYIRVYIYIYIS